MTHMMRKTLILSLLVLLCACGKSPEERRHLEVRRSAENSCKLLLEGDVDNYVSSLHGFEAMPEHEREQMRDLFAQYLEQERELRGGIEGIAVLGDTLLNDSSAVAFIEMTFGNGSKETVPLPLVFSAGKWVPK